MSRGVEISVGENLEKKMFRRTERRDDLKQTARSEEKAQPTGRRYATGTDKTIQGVKEIVLKVIGNHNVAKDTTPFSGNEEVKSTRFICLKSVVYGFGHFITHFLVDNSGIRRKPHPGLARSILTQR